MIFERLRYSPENNYLYLLAEGEDAALIDPGDAGAALALAAKLKVHPRWILHTHGHADHTGGSARLQRELGAKVLGHGADRARFAPDVDLAGRTELRLGALRIGVHPAPGHTLGSLLFEWEGRLFTGDTLFAMGCGKCTSGGDPRRLAETFRDVVGRLPGTLELHYGHDYALRNLPFARALEPGFAIEARGRAVLAAKDAGREPDLVTLDEERAVNPFLRVGAPAVAAAIAREVPAARDDLERFVALRAMRDRA